MKVKLYEAPVAEPLEMLLEAKMLYDDSQPQITPGHEGDGGDYD